MPELHVFLDQRVLKQFWVWSVFPWVLAFSWAWEPFSEAAPSPWSLPFFPLFYQPDRSLFILSGGTCGWVARICQPWKQSPSKGWRPLVSSPGCLKDPVSTVSDSCRGFWELGKLTSCEDNFAPPPPPPPCSCLLARNHLMVRLGWEVYIHGRIVFFQISLSVCYQQALLQQRPNEVQPCALRRSQSVTFEHDLGNLLDASGMNWKLLGG